MLDLPTDKPEVVAKGLTALADFAGGPDARSRARSTRSAASSSRSGAAGWARARASATSSFRCSSTSRATRSGCRSASPTSFAPRRPARLRAFYDTWYRPERMAVVAVGDIDPAVIEQGIRTTFGAVKARAAAAARAGSLRAAARHAARQRRDRSRGHAVERVDHAKAAARARAARRRLPPQPGRSACSSRCSTIGSPSCRASRTPSSWAPARAATR